MMPDHVSVTGDVCVVVGDVVVLEPQPKLTATETITRVRNGRRSVIGG
jgi:hypothetical protein